MKLQSPYRCDYCSKQKGETNHWWLRTSGTEQFSLTTWNNTLHIDPDGSVEHICSEQCAVKALSKWMAEQSKPGIVKICEDRMSHAAAEIYDGVGRGMQESTPPGVGWEDPE